MDPDANLAEQRRLVRELLDGGLTIEETAERADRLAQLVEALDAWLTGGNYLPNAWVGSA